MTPDETAWSKEMRIERILKGFPISHLCRKEAAWVLLVLNEQIPEVAESAKAKRTEGRTRLSMKVIFTAVVAGAVEPRVVTAGAWRAELESSPFFEPRE